MTAKTACIYNQYKLAMVTSTSIPRCLFIASQFAEPSVEEFQSSYILRSQIFLTRTAYCYCLQAVLACPLPTIQLTSTGLLHVLVQHIMPAALAAVLPATR